MYWASHTNSTPASCFLKLPNIRMWQPSGFSKLWKGRICKLQSIILSSLYESNQMLSEGKGLIPSIKMKELVLDTKGSKCGVEIGRNCVVTGASSVPSRHKALGFLTFGISTFQPSWIKQVTEVSLLVRGIQQTTPNPALSVQPQGGQLFLVRNTWGQDTKTIV